MSKPTLDWNDYDHLKMSAMEDPAHYLGELRSKCPVGYSKQYGGFYVLTRYADCVTASMDPRFSSMPENGPGVSFPFRQESLRVSMIHDDGDRHRDFRMQAQRFFSPKAVNAMRARIVEICDDLIDSFIEAGEADLSDQYSIELPTRLIADLLDLPGGRRREFQAHAASVVGTNSPEATQFLTDYTAELYDVRRANPGEDIPSRILDFEIDGRPITRDEWRGLVLLLILGGLDTTANAGGYIFYMIGKDPELKRYLAEEATRIPGAVPEFIRRISPVPQHSRGITEEVEIGGQVFRPGDVVQLNWLAANHDPAIFDNPYEFDPNRNNTRFLGFGHGRHICMGRHLALLELEVMIERVLTRLPDYELIKNGVRRFPSLNRGMSQLRVRFTPGRRLALAHRNADNACA